MTSFCRNIIIVFPRGECVPVPLIPSTDVTVCGNPIANHCLDNTADHCLHASHRLDTTANRCLDTCTEPTQSLTSMSETSVE